LLVPLLALLTLMSVTLKLVTVGVLLVSCAATASTDSTCSVNQFNVVIFGPCYE